MQILVLCYRCERRGERLGWCYISDDVSDDGVAGCN